MKPSRNQASFYGRLGAYAAVAGTTLVASLSNYAAAEDTFGKQFAAVKQTACSVFVMKHVDV